MVEARRNEQDRCENIDMKLIDTMAGAGQRTPLFQYPLVIVMPAVHLYAYGMLSFSFKKWIPRMRMANDTRMTECGVRAMSQLSLLLLYRKRLSQVKEHVRIKGFFEFRAALFLIDYNTMSLCRMPARIDHNIPVLLLRS